MAPRTYLFVGFGRMNMVSVKAFAIGLKSVFTAVVYSFYWGGVAVSESADDRMLTPCQCLTIFL